MVMIPDIIQMPDKVEGKVVLIDGDMICYYCAAPFEDKNEPSLAYAEVDRRIESIIEETGSEYYEIFLTGKSNFRDGLATFKQYKGNRYKPDGTRKIPQPKHLASVRSYIVRRHAGVICNGEEADDRLSIRNREYIRDSRPCEISSGDKDLLINAGLHHNLRTGIRTEVTKVGFIEWIQPAGTTSGGKCRGTGLMFFLFQLLAGDSTDNIPGLPKIGESIARRYKLIRGGCGDSKAYKILESATDITEAFLRVVAAYYDYFNTFGTYKHWRTGEEMPGYASYLVEQGRLLWMRQEEDELWDVPDEWVEYSIHNLWRYM